MLVMNRPPIRLALAIALLLATALIAACAQKQSDTSSTSTHGATTAIFPTNAPSITGIVTAIGPGASLRIEEKPGLDAGGAKAQVRVPDGAAILDRSGPERTLADIREGAIVSAWFTGPVAESYPVQATASAIVIEPSAPSGSENTSGATVNYMGYGAVRAGMTIAEAEQAQNIKLPLLGPSMDPCHYVAPEGRPVAFMVIDGKIARVDVNRESSVKTSEGARIGDTEDRIRSLYPQFIEVQPHKYTDGRYLIVRAPADSNFRIIFETDGQKVTGYRAGRMPEVRWVEGCS